MNLYLSSYRLGNHPEVLQEMSGDNKRAAVIANAADYKTDDERQQAVEREISDLAALGFKPDELDLRHYFGKADELKSKLDEYGLVWARGGNSFLLRQAMELSGFDTALTRKLQIDDTFVYAGYSAGAVVVGPTLEGIEIVDDMHAQPEGYRAKPIIRGVGIVDYCIAPHYKSDHPESAAIDDVVTYYEQHQTDYKPLKDGEVIVIRDESESVIS